MPAPFTALHRDARALLASWTAPDSRLDAVRGRFLHVLDADPTAMWRAHSPTHFTASLVVLSEDLSHVGLTLHKKARRWLQFGGHFEPVDVDVRAAAAREGREESGLAELTLLPELIQVDAHTLNSAFGHCREHLDLRFAAVATGAELSTSDESDDVRWWPVQALPADAEPSLVEAIALARAAVTDPASAQASTEK